MGLIYIVVFVVECFYVVCLVFCLIVFVSRLKQEFYCDVGLYLYDVVVVEYYFICRMFSFFFRV